MDRAAFVELNALPWTFLLVLGLLSTVGAILVGVNLLTRVRVRPAFAGLALGPLALLPALGAALAGARYGVVDGVSVAVGLLLLAPILAWIPAFLHGVLVAVAGAARGPRQTAVAAVVLALGLAACVAPIAASVGVPGLVEFAVVRAAAYLPLALLAACAALAGDPDGGAGPEAGASGGLAFAAFVGIAEAGTHGILGFFLMQTITVAKGPGARAAAVEAIHASHYGPASLGAWLTVGLAVAAAAASLVPVARARGKLAAGLGAAWLAVAPIALVLAPVPTTAWRAWVEVAAEPPAPLPAAAPEP